MTDIQKKNFYTWIGTRIIEQRTKKGITQAQLADAIGISRVSMLNIEKGKQTPSLHAIWIISEKLTVPVHYFLPLNREHNPHYSDNEIDQKIDSTPNLNQDEKSLLKGFLGDLF